MTEATASMLLAGIVLFGASMHATASKPPLATTGLDQRVDPGAKVVLVGSGRDGGGRIVRFRWVQLDGPRVTLQKANRSTAHFIAPRVRATTALRFRLTVTDNRGAQASDDITVTVVPLAAPKAITPSSPAEATN